MFARGARGARCLRRLSAAEKLPGGVESSDLHAGSEWMRTKLSKLCELFFSHNCRGLTKDEQVEEFDSWLKNRGAYAVCLQETWKVGNYRKPQRGPDSQSRAAKIKSCASVAHWEIPSGHRAESKGEGGVG